MSLSLDVSHIRWPLNVIYSIPLMLILFSAIIAVPMSFAASIQTMDNVGKDVSGATPCKALIKEDFTRIPEAPARVISAKIVAAKGNTEEYCAVEGYIQPQIQFKMNLPTKTWNGRYFQTGCGGFCGQAYIERCADALARNFAVAAQNMGHVGAHFGDGVWASDPALRRDFGRRSTHVMAVVGKTIVERFYGKKADYSYLQGCSTGGREGLLAALHWPEDFDGIVAGDPAFASRQGGIINNWIAHHLNTNEGKPTFDKEKLAFLHSQVMAKCDAIDSLEDGIIEDPRNCDFDISSVKICSKGKDGADCLTKAQFDAAQKLYDGPRHSRTGERLYPGWVVFGSEKSWQARLNANYVDQYLRFLAFDSNPPLSYSYRDFNFDTDISKLEKSASLLDPVAPHTDPDMSKFRKLGGKLIVYHGWADATVSPITSTDFYSEVVQKEGGIEKVKQWYRLFMLPGMYHCRGGDAPNTVDWLTPIVNWVENGQAPDRLVATQYKSHNPWTGQHNGVLRTRPLYPYPLVARYSGIGDIDDAANWKSAPPQVVHNDDIKWIWDPDSGAHFSYR